MRLIQLILLLPVLLGMIPASATSTEGNRLPCDSCRFQVNSLDTPFKLTGNWLFTRDDNPQNAALDVDTRCSSFSKFKVSLAKREILV